MWSMILFLDEFLDKRGSIGGNQNGKKLKASFDLGKKDGKK